MQSLKTYREQNPGKGYWEWRNSLPDNLKYTDDSEYDMQAAYKSGAQPVLEDDGLYHLPSRDPKSGRILKSSYHNTYWKALEEDTKLGYKPIMINGNTYTKRYDDTWAFQNGGETTDIEYNSNIKWSNLGKEEKNYIKNWYDGRYRYAKRHKPELLKIIESARNRFNADNNTVKNFINNKIVNNDFFSSLNTVPISIVNQDVIKGDSNTRGVYSPNEGIKIKKQKTSEQINDIEKERLRRSRLINEADNQGYKIAERLMEDPAYIKRAAKVQKEYGDDYLTTYADILQAYNENPDLLMKSSLGSLQNGARARMEATSDAVRRHMNGGQFPGIGEYNYRIDPTNMRDLTGNVTDHEWNHYVDYLKNKQPDGQGSSNLFKRMSEDIEYSDNPLDIYYGKPTEQKAYMNQLREYMFQNGIISSRDEEVSKELLQDVLNNLTNRNMDSVVRASRRMNNMDNYTKWFNSIPLLGLGAMGINKYYNQQKEK